MIGASSTDFVVCQKTNRSIARSIGSCSCNICISAERKGRLQICNSILSLLNSVCFSRPLAGLAKSQVCGGSVRPVEHWLVRHRKSSDKDFNARTKHVPWATSNETEKPNCKIGNLPPLGRRGYQCFKVF